MLSDQENLLKNLVSQECAAIARYALGIGYRAGKAGLTYDAMMEQFDDDVKYFESQRTNTTLQHLISELESHTRKSQEDTTT